MRSLLVVFVVLSILMMRVQSFLYFHHPISEMAYFSPFPSLRGFAMKPLLSMGAFGDLSRSSRQVNFPVPDLGLSTPQVNFPLAESAFNLRGPDTALGFVETENDWVLKADLPAGVEKKDVDIKVVNGMLQISAERKNERTENRNGATIIEKSYGSMIQSMPIPSSAAADAWQADLDNGVLKVTMKKKPEFLLSGTTAASDEKKSNLIADQQQTPLKTEPAEQHRQMEPSATEKAREQDSFKRELQEEELFI